MEALNLSLNSLHMPEASAATTLTSSSHNHLALIQCPALHVDEAQRTLWRLAQLFAVDQRSSSESESGRNVELSVHFSQTAHHVHDILIGGGFDVLEDRWGPSGLAEGGARLEWQDAWTLWVEKEYPRAFSVQPSIQSGQS